MVRKRNAGFRSLRQLIFLGVFVVVAALGYLYLYGLPTSWKNAVLQELSLRGIQLEIDSLHFDPWRGVVARGIHYKTAPTQGLEIAVRELALNLHLADLFRRQYALERVFFSGSDIQLIPQTPARPLIIESAHGGIRIGRDGMIELNSLVGTLQGIRLELNGFLNFRREKAEGPTDHQGNDFQTIQRILDGLGVAQSGNPLQASVRLEGRLAEPETLKIQLIMEPQKAFYDRWHAEQVEAKVDFEDNTLHVRTLQVKNAGGTLSVQGTWKVHGAAEFELSCNLNPFTLFRGSLSNNWSRSFSMATAPDVWLKGRMDTSQTNALQTLEAEGSFSIHGLQWREHLVQELKGNIYATKGRADVPNFSLVQEFGRLDGKVAWEFGPKALVFDIASTLDLAAAMKILYPSEKNWFRTVVYHKPPRMNLAGRWLVRDPNGLNAKGTYDWQDWEASGVKMISTSGLIDIKGRNFMFDRLKLIRPEGGIQGSFSMDFATQNTILNVVSSIDFASLTRMIGPKTEETFRPYHFQTPPKLMLVGVINMADDSKNDLWTHVDCEKFGIWKLSAEDVHADVRSFRKSLEIGKFSAKFYNGVLEGDATFDFSSPEQDWAFQCYLDKVDFDSFTHDLWAFNKVQGQLTGWAEMSGTMKSSKQLKGRGEIKVDNGVLWRIPLFGELSQFIPILGVQKARKAMGTFTVADEKVKVDDFKVSAGIMSLTAKGEYHFDQSLDFIVQGHFLRAFFGIGYVFDPLTKAFEYHLGGKLNDRKWKPRFIPKELLLQFGDDEASKADEKAGDSGEKP